MKRKWLMTNLQPFNYPTRSSLTARIPKKATYDKHNGINAMMHLMSGLSLSHHILQPASYQNWHAECLNPSSWLYHWHNHLQYIYVYIIFFSPPISLFTHNIIHLFITQISSYEKCGVGNVEPTNKPQTVYDWYQSEQLSVGNRRWGLYLFWSPLLCVALHLFGDKYCRFHSCLLRLTHRSKYYMQVFSTSLNAIAVSSCAATSSFC